MQSDSIQTRKKESMSLDNKAQVLSADTAMRIPGPFKRRNTEVSQYVGQRPLRRGSDRRLLEYGHNEIRAVKGKAPMAKNLSRNLLISSHFCSGWRLVLASSRKYLHHGEGMLSLGIAYLWSFSSTALFTFVQEYRAE